MGASTDADKCAVGQCYLQTQDIGAGNAVFEAAGAARIGGDVATDGAVLVALGVGWIEEPALLNLRLEHSGDDMGLDDGDEILTTDLLDAVHPVKAHQDAAPQWNASPDIAHPGPASGDGDVLPVCVGKHRRYLLGRSRRDGNFGQGGCEPLVGAQLGETRRVGDDPRLGGYQPAKVPLQVGAGGILFARGTGLGSLCAHIPMIS